MAEKKTTARRKNGKLSVEQLIAVNRRLLDRIVELEGPAQVPLSPAHLAPYVVRAEVPQEQVVRPLRLTPPPRAPIDTAPTVPRIDRPVAMLANMSLTDETHAVVFRGRFARFGRDPSLDELRTARRIIDSIDRALLDGSDVMWGHLRRAEAELASDPRFEAVDLLVSLVRQRNALSLNVNVEKLPDDAPAYSRFDFDEGPAGTVTRKIFRERQKRYDAFATLTLQRLRALDSKLAAVTRQDLQGALEQVREPTPQRGRGNRSVYTALAELAIATGAFNTPTRPRDREAAIRSFALNLASFIRKGGEKKHTRRARATVVHDSDPFPTMSAAERRAELLSVAGKAWKAAEAAADLKRRR